MNTSYPEWIDEFADAIYNSLRNHDMASHMPFVGYNFYPFFSVEWIEKLHETVRRFKEQGLNLYDLRESLPNHSSLKFQFFETILFLKFAETPSHIAKEIIEFFLEALRVRVIGDPLWLNNKIDAWNDVSRVVAEKQLVPATREQAGELGRIVMGCATLAHGLHGDFCADTAYDVYGPYPADSVYGEGTSLVVRSFGDLNPTLLWKGHKPFPYKTIRAFTLYKDVQMTPMYVACQMLYEGNLVESLTHFQLEVDGTFVNTLEDLKVVRENLLKVAGELYVEFMAMSFEEKKALWIHQLNYQLKPLFDLVDMNWEPSEEMLEKARGRELLDTFTTYNLPAEEFNEQFGINNLKRIYQS